MTARFNTIRCGIEFEYMLIDTADGAHGATPGRLRDFGNLAFDDISAILRDKPGLRDTTLATGDLGIRSGYWYLEGDERFETDGRFRTLEVKGVEIRTPPAAGVTDAVNCLLAIEAALSAVLSRHGLGLAIGGYNPVSPGYAYDPPLNAWELALRRRNRGYDGSLVSTLSYGPDINLSVPGSSFGQCLDASRKLNYYAPYMVPFSFSSPFCGGARWRGYSKRTFERAALRPAVKFYLAPETLAEFGGWSQLAHAARLPGEAGRIEFKAFDAMPSPALLSACCHLLVGVCLSGALRGRSETGDLGAYRRAAIAGFDDDGIRQGATDVLREATAALQRAGDETAVQSLALLDAMLTQRRTPSHDLVAAWETTGVMVRPGGHLAAPG